MREYLVGINRSSSFKSPQFPVALNSVWGIENGLNGQNAPGYLTLIQEIINSRKDENKFYLSWQYDNSIRCNERAPSLQAAG